MSGPLHVDAAVRVVAGDAHLTPRLRQVLVQVLLGRTNGEMAAALGISAGTVKVHMRRLLARLDALNRRELVARLVTEDGT